MADKPRPSTMSLLDQCPRFVSKPRDTEVKSAMDIAADEGTLLHACMETMTGNYPVERWDDYFESVAEINVMQLPLLRESADQVRDLFSCGLTITSTDVLGLKPDDHYMLKPDARDGVYLEVSVDPEITRPGTADIVMINGTSGVLVDYKFTRVEREHDAQMKSYVVGVFRTIERLQALEVRIVAPRLGMTHTPVMYYSRDIPEIERELKEIVAKSEDPFEPGTPGDPCAFCIGNGRCVWQLSSLRNVPQEATGSDILLSDMWKSVLSAATPEARSTRRKLRAWLSKWSDAVKEEDIEWAKANPGVDLPGFTKYVVSGRLSMDDDRTVEAVYQLMEQFGIAPGDIYALCKVDIGKTVEHVALHQGVSGAEANTLVRSALAPFMKRGADSIAFRQVKSKDKQIK